MVEQTNNLLIPWYPISYLTIASSGFFWEGRLRVPTWRCDLVMPADGGWGRSKEISLPFGSYIETCTSFYVFSGPKWPSSRVEYLDTYRNTPSFVCFPSLDATAPAPLASTHCRLAVHDAVWRNSPSVASTGPIFRRSEIVTFVTTASANYYSRTLPT
jgi:hypothetical protein